MTAADTVFVCSCEGTMPLDLAAIRAANPGATIETATQLCIKELARVEAVATQPGLTIACTYQAPIFAEVLDDAGREAPATFVNIREMAGWSDEAAQSGPKMAALIAARRAANAAPKLVSLVSEGVALIYANDDSVFAIADRLKDHLDLTVLIAGDADITPPRDLEYPIFRGRIRNAFGHLGAFTLTVDQFAAPSPSSRGALRFGPPGNDAKSECHLIIDLTSGAPLFPAPDLRSGYLRAVISDSTGIERMIGDARDLVGTFDKPRYIDFRADLCVHSRSRITGCTRCLDVCPTGAITPNGPAVAIDAAICAGCGGCSALCPTGAASYSLPAPDAAMRQLRELLLAYAKAGGTTPVVLFHDEAHGEPLIHALSHHGAGLPANVLPVAVNEVTQIGLEYLVAAVTYGASAIRILTRSRPRHDETALIQTLDFARAITTGLGFADAALGTIAIDDPDALHTALSGLPKDAGVASPSQILPIGNKRQMQRLALRELHALAPAPVERIALPAGAPMGRVNVNIDGCTLCHACVSACPTEALRANTERPELSFIEDACVQCGICARTCPEKVITLEPRLDFAAIDAPPVILKQEEPHACDRCGKEFGTRSTIARIREKLAGKHWMFAGGNADRLQMIGLCDDCRVIVATTSGIDPYAAAERPAVRTTEDYLAERKRNGGSQQG